MKCISASWIAVWALVAFWPSLLCGAVPQSINYQGRLTTAAGAPITGAANLVFTICGDSLCTQQLWTEPQSGIMISNGLFDVRLGSVNPIPLSVLNGSLRWLAITVEGQAGSRRFPLQSVPYSYRSIIADTADYVKNAGGGDCADCNTIFVNVIGPDSVYATSGTAFLGKTVGNSSANIIGLNGYGANAGNGYAYGGYFSTSGAGTSVHTGVRGEGLGASDADVYGVQGRGDNTSTGNAYGGYFNSTTNGTGIHYGLYSRGYGNSSSGAYGIDASASNGSSGPVYGGAFTALTGGTGVHYGVHSSASGSADPTTFGVWSEGTNTSTGDVYGGYFRANSSGTGAHYAVSGNAYGADTSAAYGSYGFAQNTSTGDALGGYFATSSSGTGAHYGLRAVSSGSASAATYGVDVTATNTSTGYAYGGHFVTSASGTGVHYGLTAESNGATGSATYGVQGTATNTSTGSVFAGIFNAVSSGSGTHYGLYSVSGSSSSNGTYGIFGTASNASTGSAYGAYGNASNTSGGRAYGGYFKSTVSGTGEHTGVYAEATSNVTTPCFGVYGYANNTSSGEAIAGYFYAPTGGSGNEIGIYAEAGSANGYAGWFQGRAHVTDHLWVGGDFYVAGTKSAAVPMDNGEYRAMYCQESPENWFEDFGEGQLTNGKAHIELDAIFLQTVTIDANNPMKVFVQLEGDCNGVYVSKGTTDFAVNELKGGTGNVSFSYRVVAKRKNYENKRLNVIPGPAPEEMRTKSATIQAKFEADRVATQAENERVSKEREASQQEPANDEEKQ
jgi:hypothetical protein